VSLAIFLVIVQMTSLQTLLEKYALDVEELDIITTTAPLMVMTMMMTQRQALERKVLIFNGKVPILHTATKCLLTRNFILPSYLLQLWWSGTFCQGL
jgi:hypothetical protein